MRLNLWGVCVVAVAMNVAVAACSPSADKSQALSAQPTGGPKIATEAKYDFGKVLQGEQVEHVFKIRNEGGAELRIENAHGS
jgi:hypothetical protein